MKTFNIIKNSSLVLVFSVITTLVACGSKNSDQQNTPNNNTINQQCVNCQNLFQGYSEYSANYSIQNLPALTLNWTFQSQVGTAQTFQPPQQYNSYNPYPGQTGYPNNYPNNYTNSYSNNYSGVSPIISYNGPVSASGILSVSQGINLGYCQIPAGSYQLRTVAQGQWYSATISNLRLQAVGPATLTLTLTSGRVSSPKPSGQSGVLWSEVAPIGRINGDLFIESINGYQCSQSIFIN